MRKLCTWLPRNEPNLGFLRHSPVAWGSRSGGGGGGGSSRSKEERKSKVPMTTTMTPLGILDLLWEETEEPMFATT